SGSSALDRSRADRAENNNVPTRNAPNSDQEPQRSRGPDDRPTPPHPDEMNRKTAPGRDSAAPSSPGSRRESHHSDGITDQKSLQRTSATKSAQSGLAQASAYLSAFEAKRTYTVVRLRSLRTLMTRSDIASQICCDAQRNP